MIVESMGLLAAVGLLVILAGVINGVAGFGFALVATMGMAMVVEPAVAVVVMIVPILAVNLSLVRELSVPQVVSCGRRFGPLLLAALLGTVGGLLALDSLDPAPLRIGLGLLSLAFVTSAQRAVRIPGLERAKDGCFVQSRRGMIGVGGLSGLVFGGTNVGVQLVAYLRSCELDHGLFVGVVALIFVGLNGIRVGLASLLGLYPNGGVFLLSVVAGVPAVAGVSVGKRIRPRVSRARRRQLVLILLTIIGIRLVLAGIGLL